LEKVTDFLKSGNNVGSSTFLEVNDSRLSISENVFDVSEAFSDISETLSIDGTLENTLDDLLNLDDIKLEFILDFLFSVMFVVVFVVVWSSVVVITSSIVVWSVMSMVIIISSIVVVSVMVFLGGFPLDFIKFLKISVDLLEFGGNEFHVHHELFFDVWLWSFGRDSSDECGVGEEFHLFKFVY